MIIQGVNITGGIVKDAYDTTSNLLVFIDANNATSYPSSGTTITDLSGNGYTHTLSGPGFTTVGGVKCWDCTTTGQIVCNGTGPTLPTSGFTYIAWARMIASSATYRTLFRTEPNNHPILINAGTNTLGMWDNVSGGFQSSGYDVTALATVWAQWVTTGDSSGQTFYINGQLVGTESGHTAAGNTHAYIGTMTAGQPFGYIANAYLYSVKLSAEDIFRHYWSVKQRLGI